jgi:hypothetical protein
MRLLFLLVSATLFLQACGNDSDSVLDKGIEVSSEGIVTESIVSPVDSVTGDKGNNPAYTFEAFENKTAGGWGYRIMADGVLYIEQPHIPAIQGNKGFSSRADAEKTAEFAISKMELGFVPPTLTVEELDSLGVLDE